MCSIQLTNKQCPRSFLFDSLTSLTKYLAFYGNRGPLTVNSEMPPITTAWFQSAKELGYKVCDPNGNQTEGAHHSQLCHS